MNKQSLFYFHNRCFLLCFSENQTTMLFSFSSWSHHLLRFLTLFSVLLCSISSSSTTPDTVTISIDHFNRNPYQDPWQKLNYLSASSLTRAKHLKNPKKSHLSITPLSPQSYGAYSISLKFGTPPQTIPFVMDTGSDLVWFPCTKNYQCKDCSFSRSNSRIPTFFPKLSSSSKLIGCNNPKCGWIHSSDAKSRCRDCSSDNCTQICPPYIIIYGSGSTGGILLSETLDLPKKQVPNFAVGCSLFSSRAPSGIAGFGRGPTSLPTQLRLNKFAYCLLSHRFDDTRATSSLVLQSGPDDGDGKSNGVSYTPFIKNPSTSQPEFSVYYYVGLRKITVGGKKVKIPYNALKQSTDGNGGTIVDSGSTFTFMEAHVFEPLVRELLNQTTHYRRATDIEKRSGLRPCFDISGGAKMGLFPELVFHFKGGAKMNFPLANYFSFVGQKGGAVCLTIVSNGGGGAAAADFAGGPSVILGNFQLQNYYVEFDTKNERFGFKQEICK